MFLLARSWSLSLSLSLLVASRLLLCDAFLRGATATTSIEVATRARAASAAAARRAETDDDGARGANRYGAARNSTIPTPEEAAAALGVRPTRRAHKRVWTWAWRLHKRALPLLHATDGAHPADSSLNLACLWWKALASNDPTSPAHDDGLTFDVLPRFTRHVVNRRLSRFYPRLHHANVEIRTVFLDRAVREAVRRARARRKSDDEKVRLISVGAGYDVRSIRLSLDGTVDEAHEIDLPEVVEAKGRLLRGRFRKRRRRDVDDRHLPTLVPADLNREDDLRTALEDVLSSSSTTTKTTTSSWHNIFLFEGVLIYLDEGAPGRALRTCADAAIGGGTASLVLADRLENVPGGDVDAGRAELARAGWRVRAWSPKPGLARHMCSATLLRDDDDDDDP